MRIISKIGITYNTMKKLAVQRRVEGAAIGDLYELHERVQHKFLERLISLRRSEDVEERLEELVELGTEPREVAELGLVADDGGSGEGGESLDECFRKFGGEGLEWSERRDSRTW